MREILLDPQTFFEQQELEFRRSALVVVVVAILSGLVGLVAVLELTRAVEGQSVAKAFAILFTAGVAFAVPLLLWLGVSGISHVISLFFNGTGDFRRTLTHTAWGFTPLILSQVVAIAITYVAVQQVTPPESVVAMGTATNEMTNQIVYKASSVVSIVFTLWSAFLWSVGVQEARNVSLKQAGLSVLPAALLYLLYIGSSL